MVADSKKLDLAFRQYFHAARYQRSPRPDLTARLASKKAQGCHARLGTSFSLVGCGVGKLRSHGRGIPRSVLKRRWCTDRDVSTANGRPDVLQNALQTCSPATCRLLARGAGGCSGPTRQLGAIETCCPFLILWSGPVELIATHQIHSMCSSWSTSRRTL